MCIFALSLRNGIAVPEFKYPAGEWGSFITVFKNHFARQAAAVLLKFAKATSDPHVAAALVDKAAHLKDRVEELPPPTDAIANHQLTRNDAPHTKNDGPR
jgi:hypothetical protein